MSAVHSRGKISNSDVDALEDIGEIVVAGMERVWLTVVVATASLTAFEVHGRPSIDAPYVSMLNGSADYSVAEGILVGATDNPTTLGAGSASLIGLDIRGLYSIKIRSAGTSSVLTVHYGGL